MLPRQRRIAFAVATMLSTSAPVARAQGGAGEIRGHLVEAGSGRAISIGSVTIRRSFDSARVVAGVQPRADGTFRLEKVAAGRYSLRVRALGFAPLVRADVTISEAAPVAELGALTLTPVATQLGAQAVTAERDEVALAPDRNSYSAKNMTTASGGTAIDVLRNVPSVEVDGTNKVSLRGNENVVVQINGRSSPLHGEELGTFLAQLPAHSVARVEVAPNPSAKNDPEGTAGIINIVLDQEAEAGLSGGLTAGTGTTGLANVSGNVGQQRGALTLYSAYSFFTDNRKTAGFSDRTNLAVPDPAFVESYSGGSMHPRSQNLTLRSEYKLAEHDALSVDAIISGGQFQRQYSSFYSNLDPSREVIGLFDQYSSQLSHSSNQDITTAYRRTGGPEATTFSTELRYTRSSWTSDNDLLGMLTSSATSTATATPREHDVTIARTPTWNLQSDYTHPFGTHTKLESGFKGTQRTSLNDFSAAFLDATTGSYVPAPDRANAFSYRERIGAVYSVLSQQVGAVQAQAGLRLEQAATQLDLPTLAQQFDNRYGSIFPSANVAYNITDMRQVKLSYARRISRPDPGQLSPVLWRDDARNAFHGNPGLSPEYTDAMEIAFQETRPWGSVQLTPYLRRTLHAVRYIQSVDDNGVTVGTFENVASTQTAGTDLNVTYRTGSLILFTGGSAYHYSSDAANLSTNLSTRAFVWLVRANATWKFSPLTDAQLFAHYRAPYAREGGSQTAFAMMNFAVRRKLWGDQGSLALRISDPFSLMSFGFRTADGRVIELNERRWGTRGVFLTVTRSFGQQLKLKPKAQEGEQQQPPSGGPPG